MVYRRRIKFTAEQKSEIWDRWQRGESMSSIGRLFGRDSSSIYPLLSRTGGIRPLKRKRSRLAFKLVKREAISRGIADSRSIRSIARKLCQPASTISRKINRIGGYRQYRAVPGHREGNFFGGSMNSYIATIIERHSRFCDAGQGAKQGYAERGLRLDQTGP